jgi:hypothetical protein
VNRCLPPGHGSGSPYEPVAGLGRVEAQHHGHGTDQISGIVRRGLDAGGGIDDRGAALFLACGI